MPEDEIVAALPVARAALSLDASLGEDRGAQLLDVLADHDGPASDDAATKSDLATIVHFALGLLRPREAEVLTMYFGLSGAESRTLEDIGARYGITRERVRQIKDRALSRLRRSKQGSALAALR
jgi:RNA polymerase primary sigma factor